MHVGCWRILRSLKHANHNNELCLFLQVTAGLQVTPLAVSLATVRATQLTASVTETAMLEETAVQTPLKYVLTVRYLLEGLHYLVDVVRYLMEVYII